MDSIDRKRLLLAIPTIGFGISFLASTYFLGLQLFVERVTDQVPSPLDVPFGLNLPVVGDKLDNFELFGMALLFFGLRAMFKVASKAHINEHYHS